MDLKQIIYLVLVGQDGFVEAIFPDKEEATRYAFKALKTFSVLTIEGTHFGERTPIWAAEYDLIGSPYGSIIDGTFVRSSNEFRECVYERVDGEMKITSSRKVQI